MHTSNMCYMSGAKNDNFWKYLRMISQRFNSRKKYIYIIDLSFLSNPMWD